MDESRQMNMGDGCWHLRELKSGVVEGGVLRVPEDLPIFEVELARD